MAGLHQKVRLTQLTGLRAFAAALVFLSHVNAASVSPVAEGILEQGYVGVSFFFVLSGFVLAYSYGDAIQAGHMGWREYLALRAARLLPLHILTSLPFVAMLVASGMFDPVKDTVKYGINAMLLQSWIPVSGVYFSFNAPSWSLSNEMFFYVLFPGFVFLSARARARLLLGLLLIVIACAAASTVFLEGQVIYGGASLIHWIFYIFPAFRLVEFMVGLVIFDLWSRGAFSHVRLSVLAYSVLLGAMAFAPNIPEVFRFSLFFLPVAALLLISHLSDIPSFLGRLFSSRLMLRLGEASFAFYLVHILVIGHLGRALDLAIDGDLLMVAATYALSTLLALALHLGFEKPVEKRLRVLARARFNRMALNDVQPRIA